MAYQAFRTLKSIGEGKTLFKITDEEKLRWMCEKVGIKTDQDVNAMAIQLADFLEGELHKNYDNPSVMVETFSPKYRKKVWRDLAIYPAGVVFEMQLLVV
ncbi:MAG: hypothetical protein KAX49_19570 [Halanaerobiales bacterium]|nr:hypothetical protein [Halanaerobiales bacterium]